MRLKPGDGEFSDHVASTESLDGFVVFANGDEVPFNTPGHGLPGAGVSLGRGVGG